MRAAGRLCDAEFSLIYKLQDGQYHMAVTNNTGERLYRIRRGASVGAGARSLIGRTALEQKTIHLPDCLADPEYVALEYQRVGNYRTVLGVPLRQGGAPVGVIALMRTVVKPFTERQIELVTTFADQAVIAIENARLFDEVKARTRDLAEVAGAADGNVRGSSGHQQHARRAGAGVPEHVGKRNAHLRCRDRDHAAL